jgi:hypothetical protein
MSVAASTGPSSFPEIEFCLVGGRLQALGRVAGRASAQGGTSGSSAETELDLSHLASILKSFCDGVRQLEAELPRTLSARDAAFRRVAHASKLPLSTLMGRRLPVLLTKLEAAEGKLGDAVARRNACWAAFHFAFSQPTLAAFRNLAAAFGALDTVKAIWVTTTGPCGTFSAPVSGAALQRQTIRTAPTLPKHVVSDWSGLASRHPDGGRLELYPGFAMIGAGADSKAVSLLDFHLNATEAVVAEVIDPPADAVMVTRVWEKTNKDGSRDRRYANNRSIPIVRYGLLRFTGPGMTSISYLVSNPNLARRLATAFTEFQQCMAAEAASQASAPAAVGTTRAALPERTFASVPPPPVVGQAHEYTFAALAAGAISAWLFIMGPLDQLGCGDGWAPACPGTAAAPWAQRESGS